MIAPRDTSTSSVTGPVLPSHLPLEPSRSETFSSLLEAVKTRSPYEWSERCARLADRLDELAPRYREIARAVRERAEIEGPAIRRAARGTEDITIYDNYMDCSRVEAMTGEELRAVALPMSSFILRDIAEVRPVPEDVIALLELVAGLLGDVDDALVACVSPPGPPLIVAPLCRWKLGHWVYAFANRAAQAELEQVRVKLDADPVAAAAGMTRAERRVRAITAAMCLAGAMSSHQYLHEVRETMKLEVELTGGMNLDHRSYREALAGVLERYAGETFAALADRGAPEAEPLSELLARDLVDIERHVTVTDQLVGENVSALHMNPEAAAVWELRGMDLKRWIRYAPLMRHGKTDYLNFDAEL